jgi:c-di-AMP phosphodiesterase-like protein
VAVADAERIFDTTTIAKAANQCLALKGIRASFVIGRTGNKEVKISARSDGSVNVQLLAEKLGGGGHYSMAAVTFDGSTCDTVRESLINVLDQHLSDAKNDDKTRKFGED